MTGKNDERIDCPTCGVSWAKSHAKFKQAKPARSEEFLKALRGIKAIEINLDNPDAKRLRFFGNLERFYLETHSEQAQPVKVSEECGLCGKEKLACGACHSCLTKCAEVLNSTKKEKKFTTRCCAETGCYEEISDTKEYCTKHEKEQSNKEALKSAGIEVE